MTSLSQRSHVSAVSAVSGGMAPSWESTAPGTPESLPQPSPRGDAARAAPKGGVRLPMVPVRSLDALVGGADQAAAAAASLATVALGERPGSTPRRRERWHADNAAGGPLGPLPSLENCDAATGQPTPLSCAPGHSAGAPRPSGCRDPGAGSVADATPRPPARQAEQPTHTSRLATGAPLSPLGGHTQASASEGYAIARQRAADSQELAARSVAAAQQLAALHARLGLDALLPAREALTATASAAAAASTANAAAAVAAAATGGGTSAASLLRRPSDNSSGAMSVPFATPPFATKPPFRAPPTTFDALSGGKAGLGSLLGDIDAQRRAAAAGAS